MLALIMTIILECLALFALGERKLIFYIYWICITTLTNIPANICVSYVPSGHTLGLFLTVVAVELLVFVSEALMCFLYTKEKTLSIKYSLLCNAASFLIGSMILEIILN